MLKPLVPSKDLLLHHKIQKCSYNLDRSKLSYTLNENMFHYNGVGLSANQIGIWERAFVMMTDIEKQETITCFNPKIIKESKKQVVMEEGCLSYPDLFLDIERPESVIVKYEDEGKEIHKVNFEGFIARIFLHEYDHMEGIDFTNRVKSDTYKSHDSGSK
tara:strand:- start:188 stop:667 length:480 start_codon:yes stop_codon:yes gene_type:complete